MRALWTLSVAAFAMASIAGATQCSSFGSDVPAAAPDAGADGPNGSDGAPDDASEDASTEATTEAGDTQRLPCPPPTGVTTEATTWVQSAIYRPADGRASYPWQIVADATHVTWIAQVNASDGGSEYVPYNGDGDGVVMRAPKRGGGKAAVLARAQTFARAVALDGDYVYWGTYEGTTPKLWRQHRDVDCDVACPAPELVTTFNSGQRIVKLVRPAPGVLFVQATEGQVFRVPLGVSQPVPIQMIVSGYFPAITATGHDVYTSNGSGAKVGRVAISGANKDDPFLTLQPIDGGTTLGALQLATDCSDLWMVRNTATGTALLRGNLTTKAVDVRAPMPAAAYDLAVDEKKVYVGIANPGGGVFVYDKASGMVTHPYDGNVFGLTVDDEGVYFGEHAVGSTAGRIVMMEKK